MFDDILKPANAGLAATIVVRFSKVTFVSLLQQIPQPPRRIQAQAQSFRTFGTFVFECLWMLTAKKGPGVFERIFDLPRTL